MGEARKQRRAMARRMARTVSGNIKIKGINRHRKEHITGMFYAHIRDQQGFPTLPWHNEGLALLKAKIAPLKEEKAPNVNG